jgi:hypothetical protein
MINKIEDKKFWSTNIKLEERFISKYLEQNLNSSCFENPKEGPHIENNDKIGPLIIYKWSNL